MANDQPTSHDETDHFLGYLLRCGMTAPGATISPTAGRILARLLVVGAFEGGEDLITPYMVPIPGEGATFEVRTYQAGNLNPTEVHPSDGASAALKVALRSAREGDDGIEVISRSTSGLERCVLVRDSTGDFEFRFAASDTLVGSADDMATARSRWDTTLSSWRDGLPAPVHAGRDGHREDPDDTELAAQSFRWSGTEPQAEPDHDPVPPPSSGVVGTATVRGPASSSGLEAGGTGGLSGEATTGPPVSRIEESDPMAVAMRDAVANLVVEVDFGQIEQTLRQVLEEDHREMVDPLVRRLTARLGESLLRPSADDIVHALAPYLPNPGQLADAVAADVGALLSETILRRRSGELGGVDAVSLVTSMQEMHVRLDAIQDQLLRSADLLGVIEAHLDSGDRRAAVAERIATSVSQEMQRLASRVDEQVTALAASTPTGAEMADNVARLTRKLRQSVSQFDRVLARMDAAFDLSEAAGSHDDKEVDESYQEPGEPAYRDGGGYSRRV